MTSPIPIWVDCDPGQDDISALTLAAYNPSFNLVGVSTCYGNASVEDTTRNALRFLSAIDKVDVSVYKGAAKSMKGSSDFCHQVHGQHGLDESDILPDPPLFESKPRDAFFPTLKAAIETYPGELCIAAIAPLTNMAEFFVAYPELKDKIRYMVIMGGAFKVFNWRGNSEFNMFTDSVAGSKVINDPVLSSKIILAPLDATSHIKNTLAVQQTVLDAPNETSATPFRRMMYGFMHAFYLRACSRHGPDYEGPGLHDPVATSALLQLCGAAELGYKYKKTKVQVLTTGEEDGVTVDLGEGETIVLTSINVENFWKVMFDALTRADDNAYVNKVTDGTSGLLSHKAIFDLCRRLPKVEIHCHLFGTIRQKTFLELNAREGQPFTDKEIIAFYIRGEKPIGVLKAFRTLDSQLIKYPSDLYRLTCEYLEDAHAHNIRYTEFFWNPTGTVIESKIPYPEAQGAILKAIDYMKEKIGIVGRLICAVDRADSGERAVQMVDWMLANRHPYVVGIGVDYRETDRGPELFHDAYVKARENGLKMTAHAGEYETPWQNIDYVVNTLHVNRIDHGYSMLHNPDLVKQIVESKMTVSVVPTNSYYMRNIPKDKWASEHPIRKMIKLGVHVHPNSDDPTLHNSDSTRDWVMMYECFGATIEDLKLFSFYGIDGCWAPSDLKETLYNDVTAYFKQFNA